MSTNNDYLKNKATQFISLVSGLAEKKIHQIVDKGSEISSGIEKGVQDTYHTIVTNLKDLIENFDEKQPGEFENGDLAISPVDIIYPGEITFVRPNGDATKEDNIIRAGEVFEFDEKIISYIKTPLYEPDIKTAVCWARRDEINHLEKWSESNKEHISYALTKGFIGKRKALITRPKKEVYES